MARAVEIMMKGAKAIVLSEGDVWKGRSNGLYGKPSCQGTSTFGYHSASRYEGPIDLPFLGS
jgi:hypothetical protein